MTKLQGETSGSHGSHPRPQYFATRQSKGEFPVFSGNNLNEWIFRCQHYFTVDQMPEDARVQLVLNHLEGRALQWH
ncbi:hypothetical protein AAHA92_05859 [Salvia divinorum]|uniref:Retrotransposon gag domain-containing protein n=1 Tax=Salvia divinorum TaxID=28513 RepID=A0ABD1I4R6_SALDI